MLCSRREISLRKKGRVYQVVLRSILHNGGNMWPVQLARVWQWRLPPHSTREVQRLCTDCGTLPYKYLGTARAKKAPLDWSCCKASRRWADQGYSSSHIASHVAQTSWRPAEDMGNHDHGRPLSGPLVFGYARWRKDWAKFNLKVKYIQLSQSNSFTPTCNRLKCC